MPKNWCFWTVVLEKTLESLLDCKEIQVVHPKGDQSWIFLKGLVLKLKLQYFGHLMRRLTYLKRPWCWERLKAGREEDNRGWDCWIASPTQWTWVWASSGSCWWTGKPGVLQSMGSQRVDTTGDLTEFIHCCICWTPIFIQSFLFGKIVTSENKCFCWKMRWSEKFLWNYSV